MERVAVVTGANRGIGRATAVRLARDFGAGALVAHNHWITGAALGLDGRETKVL